jgi:broad specificity phosphatase PhoE
MNKRHSLDLAHEQLQSASNPTLYLDSSHIIVLKNMIEHAINDDNTFEKIIRFGNTDTIAARPGEKTVFFIRHGQSTANVQLHNIQMEQLNRGDDGHQGAIGSTEEWSAHKDSRLTEHGISQAKALQGLVKDFNVHTIVTSPLRRAMFTATNAFKDVDIPILAWPILTEFYPDGWENRAYKLSEISDEIPLLPRKVIFDACEDEWWSSKLAGDVSRVTNLLSWIAHCPESRIAIVCHYGVIREFLRLVGFQDIFSPRNCSPVECRFSSAPPLPRFPLYTVKIRLTANQPKNPFLEQIFALYEECQIDSKLQTASQLGPLHITVADFWPISDDDLQGVIEEIKQLSNEIREQRVSWNADSNTINLQIEDSTVLFIYIYIVSKTVNNISDRLSKLPCYANSTAVRANHTTTLIRDDKPMGKSFHLADFKEKIEKYDLIKRMIFEKDDEWKTHFAKLKWKIVISSSFGDKMAFPL